MGGTCLQHGCIPTKQLVTISHLLQKMQEAENYGIELGVQPLANWKMMNTRVSQLVAGIENLCGG